jgi:hypothetical protein
MANADECDQQHKGTGAEYVVEVICRLPAEELERDQAADYRRREPAALPKKLSNVRKTLGVKLHAFISLHAFRKDKQFQYGRLN